MRPGFSTIVGDAWRLWRADRGILLSVAGLFMFLPALLVNLFLSPALDRALTGLKPEDSAARMQAFSAWAEASLPWILAVQAMVQFGGLTILFLYLDRHRMTVGEALRMALTRFAPYLIAMLLVSVTSMAGLILLIIGFFYALGRLSLVGPVIVAEREANPFAAIGRSLALTRGSGVVLTGLFLVIYCATFFMQAPFQQIDEWLVSAAPNPVATTIVGMIISALTAASALAISLVQIVVYRRLTAR